MYDLYNLVNSLCEKRNITIGAMCREAGVSKGVFTDLKMGRKKTLSAQTLSKVAAYFGVSVDYLLGIEDEYGISPDEWALMGNTFKSSRESMGFSRELAVDGEVLTESALAGFEDNGAPLTPQQLTVACGSVGLDATSVFALWKNRLWGKKESPTSKIDDELLESLELLRSRPDVRTLLHASKDMTPEQVEQMARFMQTLKGAGNEKAD